MDAWSGNIQWQRVGYAIIAYIAVASALQGIPLLAALAVIVGLLVWLTRRR